MSQCSSVCLIALWIPHCGIMMSPCKCVTDTLCQSTLSLSACSELTKCNPVLFSGWSNHGLGFPLLATTQPPKSWNKIGFVSVLDWFTQYSEIRGLLSSSIVVFYLWEWCHLVASWTCWHVVFLIAPLTPQRQQLTQEVDSSTGQKNHSVLAEFSWWKYPLCCRKLQTSNIDCILAFPVIIS